MDFYYIFLDTIIYIYYILIIMHSVCAHMKLRHVYGLFVVLNFTCNLNKKIITDKLKKHYRNSKLLQSSGLQSNYFHIYFVDSFANVDSLNRPLLIWQTEKQLENTTKVSLAFTHKWGKKLWTGQHNEIFLVQGITISNSSSSIPVKSNSPSSAFAEKYQEVLKFTIKCYYSVFPDNIYIYIIPHLIYLSCKSICHVTV